MKKLEEEKRLAKVAKYDLGQFTDALNERFAGVGDSLWSEFRNLGQLRELAKDDRKWYYTIGLDEAQADDVRIFLRSWNKDKK